MILILNGMKIFEQLVMRKLWLNFSCVVLRRWCWCWDPGGFKLKTSGEVEVMFDESLATTESVELHRSAKRDAKRYIEHKRSFSANLISEIVRKRRFPLHFKEIRMRLSTKLIGEARIQVVNVCKEFYCLMLGDTSEQLISRKEDAANNFDQLLLIPEFILFECRDYDAESERKKTVEEFYKTNHIDQSVDFVKKMRAEYGSLNRVEMSIWKCCELLNEFVDESDPDLEEPQIEHLLQTDEAIRKDYPNEEWQVCYRAHQVYDGRDEVCKCGFLVVWRHGPKLGRKSWTCVENLCLIQEEKVACSAVLHHFFRIAVQIIERNSKFDGIGIKDTKGTQQNQAHDKDIIGSEILEEQLTADVDMGGGYLGSKIIKQQENYPFIMIDYLEKDLPSSEIIDFLYQHTSISCKVYVVPCFPPESCARAIIYMKDHGETEKLWQFLNSPHQLIVSSRGRPWIIHYLWRPEVHGQTHSGSTFTFEGSPGKKRKVSQSITTVHEGSEEYEKGKRLKKLFMMFHEHFQSLHKRLTMEEKRL